MKAANSILPRMVVLVFCRLFITTDLG